jgi:hypothetical protein
MRVIERHFRENGDVFAYTFMGIAGHTRRHAFRGWCTRVRRIIGWHLIQPEMKVYLDLMQDHVRREGMGEDSRSWKAWNALVCLNDWLSGPTSWHRSNRKS